jgi:hypothetical protein
MWACSLRHFYFSLCMPSFGCWWFLVSDATTAGEAWTRCELLTPVTASHSKRRRPAGKGSGDPFQVALYSSAAPARLRRLAVQRSTSRSSVVLYHLPGSGRSPVCDGMADLPRALWLAFRRWCDCGHSLSVWRTDLPCQVPCSQVLAADLFRAIYTKDDRVYCCGCSDSGALFNDRAIVNLWAKWFIDLAGKEARVGPFCHLFYDLRWYVDLFMNCHLPVHGSLCVLPPLPSEIPWASEAACFPSFYLP